MRRQSKKKINEKKVNLDKISLGRAVMVVDVECLTSESSTVTSFKTSVLSFREAPDRRGGDGRLMTPVATRH